MTKVKSQFFKFNSCFLKPFYTLKAFAGFLKIFYVIVLNFEDLFPFNLYSDKARNTVKTILSDEICSSHV